MALVTSRGAKSSDRGLSLNGIRDAFEILITADKTTEHKPNPLPVLLALEELGVTKSEAIMVGDTQFDLIAARRAGVKSVLVSWAEINDENLAKKEYAPDYIIDRGMEILDIIDGNYGK